MKNTISKTLTAMALTAILISSCKKKEISKEQLTIIDGIVLGQSIDSLYESYKTLNIPTDIFYTRSSFSDISEVKSSMITLSYSKVFDLSDYKNSSIKLSHLGILYPTKLTGTDKIIGMNVLLVSTTEPFNFNPEEVRYVTRDNACIQQEVNELLIDEIIKIYKSKYGEPKSRIKTTYQEAFVFEWDAIKRYNGTKDEGELITWENEIMKINFFTGCKSYSATFMKNPTQYLSHWTIGKDPELPKIEYDKGIVGCYTYPYIQYTLKDSTVNLLGLDKKKI